MDNIKNLIFDFGGVLIDLDRQRCIDHFHRLGVEDVEQLLSLYQQQDFFHRYETGEISSDEFRAVIRSKTTQTLTDAQIDEAWNSFLLTIPEYKLEALLSLRQHYMVYLLSNTNATHWQYATERAFRMKAFRVEDYFEQIFLSFEMGVVKPDAEIFKRVLAETGINPAETLFLDDSPANCRAAEALGINTHLTLPGEDWREVLFR